ncbi:trm13, partial [Symbiodinium pilosum]
MATAALTAKESNCSHHSWPELLSKLRESLQQLQAPKIVDGPDPHVASVVWQLLREHPDCIELCDLYLGRHGQQVESLSREVLARGPFAHIVEVGAGKGLLGRVLQELMPGSTLTNLEINSGVSGFDRADTERVVLDVREYLEEYSNPDFLRERGFSASEWPMLIKLLAVARLRVDQDGSSSSDSSFKSWQRWEHTFGGRKAMIEIGREVRQLLEAGRAKILELQGYSTELLQYAPAHTTSENIVIVAMKPTSALVGIQNALPKVGVLLEAPSAAARVTQFLMEVRGQILDRSGALPFLAAFACSEDSVAVLGTDAMEVVAALRQHALLMVQLRIVTRIYPFSLAVDSVEDVPLSPAGVKPPFRLAVSPRGLLEEILARAKADDIELSPQRFNASITVRRLWDGSLGVACLPRGCWHPGEEPQSWIASDGGQVAQKLPSIQRLSFRLEEWRDRLGISFRNRRVRVHSPHAEWLQILEKEGIEVLEGADVDVLIVDNGRSFQRGIDEFKQSMAQIAVAVLPVADCRGGKAARASQLLNEVSKAISQTGARMSAHHLLSNRDQERT